VQRTQKSDRGRKSERQSGGAVYLFPCPAFLRPAAFCLLLPALCTAQHASKDEKRSPKIQPPLTSNFELPVSSLEQDAPLPGDWALELLDAILSSPNPEAYDALHRAAFAAGRAIIPQLKAALKDDRTAEFAAQSLAFIGGDEALVILSSLVNDPRDLNLRRFYYGALGETDAPQANKVLLEVVSRSDPEPDRTVTQAAILALTVRSDPGLAREFRQVEKTIKDVVIHDDLDNALAVIESRARFFASPEGRKAGSSVESAIRAYFAPALRPPQSSGPAKSSAARPSAATSPVKVDIRNVVQSPDKTRALARVIFEDSFATAQYDMVLQQREGSWRVASVWLGPEAEKPAPTPRQTPRPKN